jgi:sugar phosphate isomerase/epimerase
MKIGINQFSYHRFFGAVMPWERDPGVRWTLADFLDRAEDLGVDGVSLQTVFAAPEELSDAASMMGSGRFGQVVFEWGHPDGLKMGSSTEAAEELGQFLEFAAASGVRLVRIVAGYPTYRGREPVEDQIRRLVPVLRELSREAAALGVDLALENHADFTPSELVELIGQVGEEHLGAVFDLGNCVRLGADLLRGAERLAPLTRMVHLRDLVVLEESRGNPTASWPSAPLGRGTMDIEGALDRLRDGGFDGPAMIEMSNMHPDWPDEDRAVAESVRWLRAYREKRWGG